MAEQAQMAQMDSGQVHATVEGRRPEPVPRWSPSLRVAFRFCFAYFTLYSVTGQIMSELFPNPKVAIPELGVLWPLRQITFWTAAHVFRVTQPLVYSGSGSGDKIFDWVQTFCFLVMAVVVTAIWSVLDRLRPNYIALHKWFYLLIRFGLLAEMLVYGFSKVIPLQMPFPSLGRLLRPFGSFSPMDVLWASIGASRSYEIFAGSAEVLGGILLIFPRTTTLGALVCLADMIQVFMLNMTYDVPVKLFSFHLILLSLFLLAPQTRRLISFFFLNQATALSAQAPLFRSSRKNRAALILQVAFGLYLIGMNVYQRRHGWYQYGGGQPKSVLYGIWEVEQMSIDGQIRSPLLTDSDRWRRVLFESTNFTSFQRMDDSFKYFTCVINEKDKTIALTQASDTNWKAGFSFDRPAQDQLTLDGAMDGHKMHIQLKLYDRNKFTLVNRGFHWISEYPFQR